VPESEFERYKAALKAGHIALLRERLGEALDHYGRAAEIAPERPLPHASRGRVLLRLGRVEEALQAYARALGRAPRDEGSLAGRAEALLVSDRQREAAEVLERLAEVQVETERLPEGLATMRRALELHATKRRRKRVEQLVAEVPGATAGPAPTPAPEPEAAAEPAAELAAEAEPSALPAHAEPAAEAEPSALPAHAEPAELEARAELSLAYGRRAEAVEGYLAAARAYAAVGAPDAALEACGAALALAPSASSVHLALVRQYLDRGWRDVAAHKVALLGTLADLDPSALSPEGWAALEGLRAETGATRRPTVPATEGPSA
jgi:tetratricopeptide (TPR) repeat protein